MTKYKHRKQYENQVFYTTTFVLHVLVLNVPTLVYFGRCEVYYRQVVVFHKPANFRLRLSKACFKNNPNIISNC